MTMNVPLIKHNNVDGVILPIAYENKKWLENVRRLTKQNKNIIINYWTNNYKFCEVKSGMRVFLVCYGTLVGTGVIDSQNKGNTIEECFNKYDVNNGIADNDTLIDFINMVNQAFATPKVLTKDDKLGCVLLKDVVIFEENEWVILKNTNIRGTYY